MLFMSKKTFKFFSAKRQNDLTKVGNKGLLANLTMNIAHFFFLIKRPHIFFGTLKKQLYKVCFLLYLCKEFDSTL